MILPGCNNTALQRPLLYQYANQAGFSGAPADTIVAIALAESGGNTCSYNPSDPFGGSFGVLQINGAHFGSNGMSQACALDPACAFRFAHGLWSAQGFQPWGTFTNGSYKQFLQAGSATQAAPVAPGTPGTKAAPGGGNIILDQLKMWGEYIAIFLLALGLIVIGFLLLGGQQVARKVI